MPETLETAFVQLRHLLTQPDTLARAIGTGRQRHARPPWRRVELRPVQLRRGKALQITTFDERQAHTRQCAFGPEAEREAEALLQAGFAHWHVDTHTETWQLRVTKRGEAQMHRQPVQGKGDDRVPGSAAGALSAPDLAHNREKHRLLDADDPLWQALGMADGRGGIKPTAQAKYRQVDAFLRLLAPLASPLAAALPQGIDIVDLGCGNAALTFAAYRYLTRVLGLPARLHGVDIKAQARERNTALARALGYDDVTFIQGSIQDAVVPRAHMVLALHACDTATDEALARAIGWQSEAVLAAPCCHHHIQAQLKAAGTPAPYNTVMRHGILGERWADVLTDALRAAILRDKGWRTDVVEFIPSQHTPRNALLRAWRTGAAEHPDARADYDALCALWQVKPYLAGLPGVS